MEKIGGNVFVWGTFDIIHDGHLSFFKAAKALGDRLYVIVLPDKYLADHKRGIAKKENIRRENLLNNPIIDGVFIDSLHDGFSCFEKVKLDIFCFGYDQNNEWQNKLREYLVKNFPKCRIIQLPEFAGGIHSSHFR
ncbi:MAG: FAD synthase [Candidatus Jorgensenbacteria bacterium GW2011_GWA1_48_11]|uniref:FAD synthase n=1 Tax=Candidatus Jorgensenbacteria bacterium GW2011_GWA1_48_11 TaxID=1618660 RepID=A0A0G1U9Q8_9BACT|nr:MAG: FAD synthase [Candidatus Jorgensenbacteria bacterium GW2011_GWA1_48_11]KKW12378.1 MAG: FAD synthase [Candidatus Jorgensenbacteria bacterium GW2011_GWB1_49_9]